MEKGIIRDVQYKNNALILKIRFNNREQQYEASIGINEYKIVDELYKNKERDCEFEADSKNLKRLIVAGKEIELESAPAKIIATPQQAKTKKNEQDDKKTGVNKSAEMAKAPYNFIPINKTVVKAENQKSGVVTGDDCPEIPSFDRYHGLLNSGHIELSIKALTPLYIRDSYNEKDIRDASEAEAQGEKWENLEFFSPGGQKKIPGSSLRGMVRNLVEIVSYSQMEFVDDSRLYYRAVADGSKSFRDHYFGIMGTRGTNKNRPDYKFKAGYLTREGKDYYIIPAEARKSKQYSRVPKSNLPEFSFSWQKDGSCITVSGSAPNTKKQDWLIYPADKNTKRISISKEDLKSYQDDINRYTDNKEKDKSKRKDGDLLRWLEVEEKKVNSKKMVPCFYVLWKDKNEQHVSFGHTAYFRLAYRLSIKRHLPAAHFNNEQVLDISKSIFGTANKFTGRVFFEDARIIKDLGQYDELSPKILSTPKPTTFQHYLEQGKQTKDDLWHWDNKEALIRGHKLYWHRITTPDSSGWEATPEEKEKAKSQLTCIKPLKAGNAFSGRIRFENLSDVELGALLFVLDLPQGCAHKIGMGKPLGLGSVKITPELFISNRGKGEKGSRGRYERLFDNNWWYLSEAKQEHESFKDKFASHIVSAIKEEAGNVSGKDLWSVSRMQELKAMLRYDEAMMQKSSWLERTRYMEIEREGVPKEEENEFKQRLVLARPSSIIAEE